MAKRLKSNKNIVWQAFFDKYGEQILDSISKNGAYELTANQLGAVSNSIQGPDVRNLTKFDRSSILPEVFKKDARSIEDYINIMPIGSKNKEYTFSLGRFNAYKKLEYDENQKPEILAFPEIETISQETIPSENTFIDVAFTSGMLDKAFGEKHRALMPVLHGRMGSGAMKFDIGNNIPISVKSAQIEIDATFESSEKIVLIEAKAVPEPDFLVRQLFYPYYVIQHRGITKPIIPTFLVLLAGNYYFLKYEFTDSNNYSSIRFVEQKTFRFAENYEVTLDEIIEHFKTIKVVDEPRVPFPQADSFIEMVKVLGMLNKEYEDNDAGLTEVGVAALLGERGYQPRQGGYYGNLIVYLGLGDRESVEDQAADEFVINETGQRLLGMLNTSEGRLEIIDILLSHVPFRSAFETLLKNDVYKETRFSRQLYKTVEKKILESGGFYDSKSKNMKTNPNETTYRRSQSAVSLIKSIIFDYVN